ncbi:MAG: DUF6482 family protein [Motiliproteus sp.]
MDVKTFGREVQNGKVESINILSNEGDIYTAQVVIDGRQYTLEKDSSHQPLVFHSFIEAKREFERYAVPLTIEPSDVDDQMVNREAYHH